MFGIGELTEKAQSALFEKLMDHPVLGDAARGIQAAVTTYAEAATRTAADTANLVLHLEAIHTGIAGIGRELAAQRSALDRLETKMRSLTGGTINGYERGTNGRSGETPGGPVATADAGAGG